MDQKLIEARAARKAYPTLRTAAAALGIAASTLHARLRKAEAVMAEQAQSKGGPVVDPVPDGEASYDELKDMRRAEFLRKLKRRKAERWRGITFPDTRPVGIVTVGDPHLDDDGCNWPQLTADTETIKATPGMYAGSIGDQLNNWVGRLTIKYAHQSSTAAQGWRLSEGWIRELSDLDKLIFMIRGNHDAWAGNGDPLDWIMRGIPAVDSDWQAQIAFQWPGVDPVRMWAAHDFPGHSQYNPLHAMTKKHLWHGGQADIYIAGHRHHWALAEEEDEAGKLVWKARARGYKYIDEYADKLGHAGQQYGASITFVIQPAKVGPERIRGFPSVQEAAEFLTFCRGRHG